MDSSPSVRKRTRSPEQRKVVQDKKTKVRVAAIVDATPPDSAIDLNDVFPSKELLRRHETSGDYILPQNIGERFRHIERYHAPEPVTKEGKTRPTRNAIQINDYTRDFIFQTLHQLLLAQMPMDQIALRFDVTVRTVYRWRDQLQTKMAAEIRSADPMPILGEALTTYAAIAAEGHKLMLGAKDAAGKRAGAEIALKAMGDKMKVLQMAGFFDSPLMKAGGAGTDDQRTQAANALQQMALEFMRGAPPPMLPSPSTDNTGHRQWSVPEGAELVEDDDEDQ